MRTTVLAAIAGLVLTTLASDAPAQTKTPVAVVLDHVDAEHAALAYGVAKGVYAKEGLDVTFTVAEHGSTVAKRLTEDGARFGVATAPTVVRAVTKDNAPLKMIANYQRDRPYAFAGKLPPGKTEKDLHTLHGMGMGLIVNTKHEGARDLNCRMVRATSQAWLAARKDPAGAADAYNQIFEKKERAYLVQHWKTASGWLSSRATRSKPTGWMAESDWHALVKQMVEFDVNPWDPKPKPVTAYYTNAFVDCK